MGLMDGEHLDKRVQTIFDFLLDFNLPIGAQVNNGLNGQTVYYGGCVTWVSPNGDIITRETSTGRTVGTPMSIANWFFAHREMYFLEFGDR